MMAATLDNRELQLAREASEWRLLSLLFECPNDSWRHQIESLLPEIADEDLRSAAKHARDEASEGLFHHAFGPGGPAPAREASYRNTVDLGYFMSELQTYYNAFAFSPATSEPADHVSVEAGFIAYLKLKQCYALACGEQKRAAVTQEAVKQFLAEHLALIATPFAESLRNSGIRYLGEAATSLEQRVGRRSNRKADLLPILEENEEISC